MRTPLLPLTLLLLVSTVATLEINHSKNLELNTTSRSNLTISAAWYTGWHAIDFPLSKVSWSKYTHLIYAFGITTPTPTTLSLNPSDKKLLPQFVSTAHQNNVKAILSLGGWTGSQWFSTNVGTASNRTAFVKTVTDIVQQFNLDGVDFDWEFPGIQGIGCNAVNPDDTSNFLAFLQQLRSSSIGHGLILSAAAGITPWVDSSGVPSENLSEFSKVLDIITIMDYDLRSNPTFGAGPSSPLNDSCAPMSARFGSAVSAVDAWAAAGIPKNQILLGVPAYGHSYVVPQTKISSPNVTHLSYPPFDLSLEQVGDTWSGDGVVDVCGNVKGPDGTYTYWGLMQQNFLNTNGTVKDGIEYRFDGCSMTPYLYNTNSHIYISYDSPLSLAVKGAFINATGLKGFAMWEAGGDYQDALLDSILNAIKNGGQNRSTSTSPTSSATLAISLNFGPFILPHALFFICLSLCAWLL